MALVSEARGSPEPGLREGCGGVVLRRRGRLGGAAGRRGECGTVAGPGPGPGPGKGTRVRPLAGGGRSTSEARAAIVAAIKEGGW
jgi:hypothetical protein